MGLARVWDLRLKPLFAAVGLLLAAAVLGLLPVHGALLVPPACVHALEAHETPVQLDLGAGGQPEFRHVNAAEIPALVARLQAEFGYGANDGFFEALPEKYEALGRLAHLPLGQRTDEYWVVVFPDGEIAGGIGLANLNDHGTDHEWWLEWFFLSPRVRGHRLGEQLIAFIEGRARAHGARSLSLYTSTASQEAAANHLYERRGYHIYQTAPDDLIVPRA